MISKRQRVRALIAVATMAASMFVAQAAFSTAAQAHCDEGTEVTTYLVIDNLAYASENPIDGTCNDNNTFRSSFRAHLSGWRASIWIQNNGEWTGHYGAYNTLPVEMSYEDTNSHSLLVICVNNVSGSWKCGAGNSSSNSVGGPDLSKFVVNEGF